MQPFGGFAQLIVRRAGVVCVLALVVVAAAPAGASAAEASRGTWAKLVNDTRGLSAQVVEKALTSRLTGMATAAHRAARSKPCTAVRTLKRFQRLLPRGGNRRRAKAVATLRADAATASAGVLASGRSAACGGAKAAAAATTAAGKLVASDSTGLTWQVDLPPARFVGRTGAGKGFAQLFMAGMTGGGAGVGTPEVPSLATTVALPEGATTSVKVLGSSSYMVDGVQLWPNQEQAADKADPQFLDPPFTLDRGAYGSDAPFPPAPAVDGGGGRLRDISTGSLRVFGAQYQPRSAKLRVFTQVTIRMDFVGGKGQFGTARTLSGWEDGPLRRYAATFSNWKDIAKFIPVRKALAFCGEELLIVTPAALRAAADTLAAARQADGFRTRVVETGSAPVGTTKEEIQAFIRGELNSTTCEVRPSYIVLMGDTAQLPTFTPPTPYSGTAFDGLIASDLPYSTADDADNIADAALGRIPAPDLATAQTVVGKIVGYEDTPPADDGKFYSHALNASYFQGPDATDDRTFIRTSERVRNELVRLNNSVDRVYTNDGASVDPQFFDDGTPIPAVLRKPAFAWNGATQNVADAWNAGRFMVFHRDHGFTRGWSDPSFTSDNVAALTNGALLPVVFSINCASGRFDSPGSPSFAEAALQKPGGGAVGVIGDSRNSPTGTNSNMALGMFDALFPNLVPSFGGDEPIRRMGDVLNIGKTFVDNQENPGAGRVQAEHLLYHWFGDPTMQMWGGNPPPKIIKPEFVAALLEDLDPPEPRPGFPPYRVRLRIQEPGVIGGVATLLRKGIAVGKATITGDGVAIDSDSIEDPADLSVVIDRAGFVSGRIPVKGFDKS